MNQILHIIIKDAMLANVIVNKNKEEKWLM